VTARKLNAKSAKNAKESSAIADEVTKNLAPENRNAKNAKEGRPGLANQRHPCLATSSLDDFKQHANYLRVTNLVPTLRSLCAWRFHVLPLRAWRGLHFALATVEQMPTPRRKRSAWLPISVTPITNRLRTINLGDAYS
jgi:hypothetical protein